MRKLEEAARLKAEAEASAGVGGNGGLDDAAITAQNAKDAEEEQKRKEEKKARKAKKEAAKEKESKVCTPIECIFLEGDARGA